MKKASRIAFQFVAVVVGLLALGGLFAALVIQPAVLAVLTVVCLTSFWLASRWLPSGTVVRPLVCSACLTVLLAPAPTGPCAIAPVWLLLLAPPSGTNLESWQALLMAMPSFALIYGVLRWRGSS